MMLVAFAILLLWWGSGELLHHYRVSRWPTVKANVVRWSEALDTNGPSVRFIHEVVVTQADGSEVTRHLDSLDPDAFYLAQLVYFVDGVAYAADLAFRQPTFDSCELHYDPSCPSRHGLPSRFPVAAALQLAMGITCAIAAL